MSEGSNRGSVPQSPPWKPLSQSQHAYVVGAAKHLLDALNVSDPFHVVMAYEKLEPIVKKWREDNPEG